MEGKLRLLFAIRQTLAVLPSHDLAVLGGRLQLLVQVGVLVAEHVALASHSIGLIVSILLLRVDARHLN